MFDTSLLGIKELTLSFEDRELRWLYKTALTLSLTPPNDGTVLYNLTGGSQGGGAELATKPDDLLIFFLWELWSIEPLSLSTALENFNIRYTGQTSPPLIEGPSQGQLSFDRIGPAYAVTEPATLSLLALGLAAIGIRRRLV